jgi:hypothetical protein
LLIAYEPPSTFAHAFIIGKDLVTVLRLVVRTFLGHPVGHAVKVEHEEVVVIVSLFLKNSGMVGMVTFVIMHEIVLTIVRSPLTINDNMAEVILPQGF